MSRRLTPRTRRIVRCVTNRFLRKNRLTIWDLSQSGAELMESIAAMAVYTHRHPEERVFGRGSARRSGRLPVGGTPEIITRTI